MRRFLALVVLLSLALPLCAQTPRPKPLAKSKAVVKAEAERDAAIKERDAALVAQKSAEVRAKQLEENNFKLVQTNAELVARNELIQKNADEIKKAAFEVAQNWSLASAEYQKLWNAYDTLRADFKNLALSEARAQQRAIDAQRISYLQQLFERQRIDFPKAQPIDPPTKVHCTSSTVGNSVYTDCR